MAAHVPGNLSNPLKPRFEFNKPLNILLDSEPLRDSCAKPEAV
jgi:hypothetical protein